MKEPIFFLCLLIFSVCTPETAALFNNVCRLFKNGTILRDPYACDSYITCVNSVEVSTKCPKGQQYSISSNKCVSGADNCDDPCAPDGDDIWVADPKTCGGFYYCNKGVGSFGACPYELHFHEDEQQCVYEYESTCTQKEHDDSYCHFVPPGIPFVNEKSCGGYKECSKKNKLDDVKCDPGKMYERELEACIYKPTEYNCRPVSSSTCKNSLGSAIKNKFVADPNTCRGYFYCRDFGKEADVDPPWGQCPEGLFFNSAKSACMDPLLVPCKADRCDGRPDMFVNNFQDCTHYATCKGGATIAVKQCANYMFFDEKIQACTNHYIDYDGCRKS